MNSHIARSHLCNRYESRVIYHNLTYQGIDHETDTIIQASIRKELKDVTLIIIAHRLQTIMDADRIVSPIHYYRGRSLTFDTDGVRFRESGRCFSVLPFH